LKVFRRKEDTARRAVAFALDQAAAKIDNLALVESSTRFSPAARAASAPGGES